MLRLHFLSLLRSRWGDKFVNMKWINWKCSIRDFLRVLDNGRIFFRFGKYSKYYSWWDQRLIHQCRSMFLHPIQLVWALAEDGIGSPLSSRELIISFHLSNYHVDTYLGNGKAYILAVTIIVLINTDNYARQDPDLCPALNKSTGCFFDAR